MGGVSQVDSYEMSDHITDMISALTSLKRRQVKGRSLHDLISAKTLKRKTCLNNKNDQENLLPANQKDESVELVFVFRQIDH